MGFTDGSDGKESACNVENPGSIPGSGRSPGEGNSCPLQYSYLENSMDRGPGRLQSMGLQRVRHEWETNTFTLYIYGSLYVLSSSGIVIHCCIFVSVRSLNDLQILKCMNCILNVLIDFFLINNF